MTDREEILDLLKQLSDILGRRGDQVDRRLATFSIHDFIKAMDSIKAISSEEFQGGSIQTSRCRRSLYFAKAILVIISPQKCGGSSPFLKLMGLFRKFNLHESESYSASVTETSDFARPRHGEFSLKGGGRLKLTLYHSYLYAYRNGVNEESSIKMNRSFLYFQYAPISRKGF